MEKLSDGSDSLKWPMEPVKNGPQYIAAVSLTLFMLSSGTVLGWTSPSLPLLKSPNSTLPITDDESTWIASLMPLAAIIGPFPGGVSADMMGRKRSMLIVAVLILASWSILAAAKSVWYIYLGRVTSGFALGWGMTVMAMYLGEISTPDVRGALGVFGQIQICLGFIYVYSFGPFVSYTWLCILCGAIAVIFFATFVFMPESPFYLVLKDDIKGATKALTWLRGQSAAVVKQELVTLQVEVDHTLQNKGTWKDLFMNYANRKAIILITWQMTYQQFCGINAVLFYSEDIFAKAGSGLSPSSSTIVVGVVMTAASLAVPYLVSKMGRRPIFMASAITSGLALLAMGVYFYMDHIQADVSNLSWLPLSSILIYVSTFSFGVGPIPWLMIAEVFAPNVRAHGAAFSAASSWFMTFIVTKMFDPMVAGIGPYGAFWFFGAISIAGAVFAHYFMIETKGLTLQEIQVLLNKK